MGWLEIERREGSVTLSRDHWFGQKAVFMSSGAKIRVETEEPTPSQLTERS
jgi:hypothetical protein